MEKGHAVGRWTCNRCNTLIKINEAIHYEPPYNNLSLILCPECYKIMKSKEDENIEFKADKDIKPKKVKICKIKKG